jgi:transcriptional regulator with GAF, ATPase, and Fis domain
MQAKILRVLQEREFERMGGTRTLTADVRVIAATHRDLDAAVAQGTFRQDLFYRLQGVGIVLPPLRERVDDLPLLATHLLERAAQRLPPARGALARGPALPLDLLVARQRARAPARARGSHGALRRGDPSRSPPPAIQRAAQARPAAEAGPEPSGSLDEALEEWEGRMILAALQQTQGVQARAAKILGVSERSLWYRIEKLGIQVRTPDDAQSA